ncbi:MAG: FkbM family methyltransferase [Methylacidiphilales bacterium]|nr:FkbM family methyltransferase [Candidatus Methylacidiphilales bacterium]
MSNRSFYKRYIRPLLPFPHRRTLKRWFPPFEHRNIAHLVAKHGITLVLDVGANEGQFGRQLRATGYRGRIVSFEPIGTVHATLSSAAGGDSAWIIAPPLALGRSPGHADIDVHADTSISSFRTLRHIPFTAPTEGPIAPTRRERVEVARLDDIFDRYVRPTDKVLLKIDVQGFESEVLSGATASLPRVEAVLIEVSLVPMYDDEPGYLDMLGHLRSLGFHAVFFSSVMGRRRLGEEWEYNAFCVRRPPVAPHASHLGDAP